MDKKTHEFAISKIWECLTGNVDIYYHKPILPSDVDDMKFSFEEIYKTKSTILIETRVSIRNELYVTWIFTFIKIKN